MNFDEKMAEWFSRFPDYQYDRKTIESDPFFQKAVKEQNFTDATNRALEMMPAYGNVRTKHQMRSKMKRRDKGAFDEFA